MLILGIDTATSRGSVALVDSESGIVPKGEVSISLSAAHSERLIPYIDFLLSESSLSYGDIDLIAISIGPGSFTGLRVGLATAKGLAFSLKKPLIAVNSLMARAFPFMPLFDRVGAYLDAKRGEVFAAIFENNSPLLEPIILPFDKFLERCRSEGVRLIVSEDVAYIKRLKEAGFGALTLYNAISLCELGYAIYSKTGGSDIDTLSPLYLRDFLPGKKR